MKKLFILAGTLGVMSSSFAKSNDAGRPLCSPTAHQQDLRQAIKWYRDSAEQKAIYQQTFVIGTQYVQAWVDKHHPKPKTWGVVLDIDETALDNSWYFYHCEDVTNDTLDFSHYVTMAQKSVATPGVVTFTHAVHQLGGYVSLVSNRDGTYFDKNKKITALEATVANLKQQNVYFDQVLLANPLHSKDHSNKDPRFKAILSGIYDGNEMVWDTPLPPHAVVAYFGDNVQDFPGSTQKALNTQSINEKGYALFGHGYFLLPNPMYGSWRWNLYR